MLQINEILIYSVDKTDDAWSIEGEIFFESDFSTVFSVTYLTYEDELEDLELEVNPGKYDKNILKDMIVEAADEFNE